MIEGREPTQAGTARRSISLLTNTPNGRARLHVAATPALHPLAVQVYSIYMSMYYIYVYTSDAINTLAAQALCWCRGSKIMASAGLDRAIALWEPLTGRLFGRLEGHKKGVKALQYKPK